MLFRRMAIIGTVILAAAPARPADRWSDEFPVASLNESIWCACQINMSKAPIELLEDPDQPGNSFARITADINSLGGNECEDKAPQYECGKPICASALARGQTMQAEPDMPEDLGPSFLDRKKVAPLAPSDATGDPYCDSAIAQRARAAHQEGACIQRQELRLQPIYVRRADRPQLYRLRFRMPAHIQDVTNSVRWVTAQWKQEPVSPAYKKTFDDNWSPSPVVAQRFDDGVLHVTVQDEDCRCRVASAPLPDGSIWPAKPGIASDCISTKPGDPPNTVCTPDLRVEYGSDPTLPSARGKWVDMQYQIQMSRSQPAVVEVYADGRFIVRVTGKIGYEPAPGKVSKTKFKIGHYRDYLPSVDTIDIDRVEVEAAD